MCQFILRFISNFYDIWSSFRAIFHLHLRNGNIFHNFKSAYCLLYPRPPYGIVCSDWWASQNGRNVSDMDTFAVQVFTLRCGILPNRFFFFHSNKSECSRFIITRWHLTFQLLFIITDIPVITLWQKYSVKQSNFNSLVFKKSINRKWIGHQIRNILINFMQQDGGHFYK